MPTIESKFVADNGQRILRALEVRGRTAKELSDSLDLNYSSTRKALQYLLGQGLVTTKPGQLRNAEWTINTHITSNQIIPQIQTLRGVIKLDDIMAQYNVHQPNAARAVLNIARHVVRIFAHAKRLANGQTTTVGLDLIRADVERDYAYIQQVASIYEQVLKYPRIWDPVMLAKFPEDIDFDEELYTKAYEYYFKDEPDA